MTTSIRHGLSRAEMAARVAKDIHEGSYVNLGIGLPTTISDYLPDGQEIILHTENGMLGMGRAAIGDEIDGDLLNAGKIPVIETPGAAYFHHADSFGMMRGGHLDVCVLGAFQVSASGDLANWDTGKPGSIPAVGGAMDLAIGAKRVYVLMDLKARDGTSKLVQICSYPVTGIGCVTTLYTDAAVFQFVDGHILVEEIFGDWDIDELREFTGLALLESPSTALSVASK